ncbi:MAG TPA: HEAT repeat domain-containing protein [Kofleriaceae bacterium]|nr:HEAT repeat domain-containing protein [Kofleriaceae bacterium]
MQPLRRRLITLLLAAGFGLGAGAGTARAEKVHDLSQLLAHSKSEKERIAAAVSLGRLRDDRALKPLVRALSDESNVVRALAATALGYLDQPAALPALQRASRDPDMTVRRSATEAIATIRRSASATGGAVASAPVQAARYDKLANYAIAPHEPARTPQVYVMVKSAQDKSLGSAPVKARQLQANAMRSMMVDELKRDQQVTLMQGTAAAAQTGLEPYSIDVTITRLERMERGAHVEIECEIRVAVSDERGKMLSFLTGGAKVQVPKRTFRNAYEPQLKREALENAVKSVRQDLVAYLRNRPS